MWTCINIQNYIKIIHADYEVYAFLLTVDGRTDNKIDQTAKMMHGEASSRFCILLKYISIQNLNKIIQAA